MSYDLYFTAPRVSLEAFNSHFAGDIRYQLSSGEAIYQNQDTGVYFIFRYSNQETGDAEEEPGFATFNINYYRPHYFGLEAVQELTGFIEAFRCSVFDPQMHGMGEGPFSPEAFLRGWNHGNEFGYSAVLKGERPPGEVWHLPTDRLEAIWRWNYRIRESQAALSEDVFIPRIFFIIVENRVASAAVWPDAISEILPEVDILLIGRDRLAPRRFFRGTQKDECLLPFEDVRPILDPYRTSDFPINAFRLPSPITPQNLHDFIRSLKPSTAKLRGVSTDQVLNSEIVKKTTAT
jgi:hypothetical protein